MNRLVDLAILIGIEPAIDVFRERIELVEGGDQFERRAVVGCKADEVVLALSRDGRLRKTAGDDDSPCIRAFSVAPRRLRRLEVSVALGGRDHCPAAGGRTVKIAASGVSAAGMTTYRMRAVSHQYHGRSS